MSFLLLMVIMQLNDFNFLLMTISSGVWGRVFPAGLPLPSAGPALPRADRQRARGRGRVGKNYNKLALFIKKTIK